MGLSLSTIVTGMKKKKESPPRTSLLSFPNDIVLNILARISRIHYPSLSLVSKTFRSLLASHELENIRSLLGKQPEDDCIYVCLRLRESDEPKPRWLSLHPNPNHKSTPIPSFPDEEHPNFPSVLQVGSEIYIIGGFVDGSRSRKVFLLDVKSHQWRILPEMHVPRGNFAAGVLEGKIYVVGGSESNDEDNWGEVYDPKIQTWTTMQTTTPDLSIRKTFVHDIFVVEGRTVYGKIYYFQTWFCLLVKNMMLCKASSLRECLMWCDLKEKLVWREIKGLGLPKTPNFISLGSSGDGLSVWWCSRVARTRRGYTWEIRCAQITIERRSVNEAWGIVEWSKILFTVDGIEMRRNKVVHITTHTH